MSDQLHSQTTLLWEEACGKDWLGKYFVLRVGLDALEEKYKAFHIVLRDYKHLWQENRRAYFNGIVHGHRKTDFFKLELQIFDDTAHIDTIFKFSSG